MTEIARSEICLSRRKPERTKRGRGFAERRREPAPNRLTSSEGEVLACLARGLSNREIARELDQAESTVRKRLTAVYRKFGVTRRYALLALFG